ncbi:(2Fe-2S) ferredoxin domain-containing protein [Pseudopedobacter saltans]|nr:(2Fe-2S) ferredoxin domain-containing protein [Pseudopedobacter saltans]
MSKFCIPEHVIYICTGSKCSKRGGKECYKTLKSFLKDSKLRDKIELVRIECTDRCKFAPVLNFQPDNIWLKEYSEKEVLTVLSDIAK